MINKRALGEQNKTKYAQPPSWEQIDSFIKELGMTMYHFEKFYGITYNHLTQVKSGVKRLGSAYWHIIYERIKPTYGAGFLEDYSTNEPKKRTNSVLPSKLPLQKDIDDHNRLHRVK